MSHRDSLLERVTVHSN